MNEYVIMTDTSCDIKSDMAQKYGLEMMKLGSELDGKPFDAQTSEDIKLFYRGLREKKDSKTYAANADMFLNAFKRILKQGKDILYLAFSSALSGTYNAAVVASHELSEEYPERKIYVFDTKCASYGEGLLVYLAALKKEAGASIDEVFAYVEEIRPHLCHWFTVDDLFFLKRGGRVSAATAVVGSMLSIKPVLHVDDEGRLINVGKARGRRNAINELFQHMKNTAIAPSEQTVFISHGDCIEDAELLAEMIRKEFSPKEIKISEIGPVIGAHSGPGTLALFFLGTER